MASMARFTTHPTVLTGPTITSVTSVPGLLRRELRRRLHDWSVAAQQQARHNAMLALTECTERRIEREDVERFIAGLAARRAEDPVSLHA